MSAALSVDDVSRREFWVRMCPGVSIEAGGTCAPAVVGEFATRMAVLKREGYVQVPDALPESVVAPIRAAVSTLFQRGIPLAFAFVYDELWQAFRSLSEFLSHVLGPGYRALPDFWVWHVNPSDDAVGWGPHRDRLSATLDDDNSPRTLTVWLPFSDATPLNGCMYMLPAHRDPRFVQRRWDGEDNTVVRNLQDIRALPATAGTLFAWNQAVLHWGGRGSDLGAAPRISAAFEFQRSDCVPFNSPLLDPYRVPTFTERLGLIGKQVLQYRHMYPLPGDIEAIATVLAERYLPEVVESSAGLAAARW